jgi:hypothetical protein
MDKNKSKKYNVATLAKNSNVLISKIEVEYDDLKSMATYVWILEHFARQHIHQTPKELSQKRRAIVKELNELLSKHGKKGGVLQRASNKNGNITLQSINAEIKKQSENSRKKPVELQILSDYKSLLIDLAQVNRKLTQEKQEWIDVRLPEFLLSDIHRLLLSILNRNLEGTWRNIPSLLVAQEQVNDSDNPKGKLKHINKAVEFVRDNYEEEYQKLTSEVEPEIANNFLSGFFEKIEEFLILRPDAKSANESIALNQIIYILIHRCYNDVASYFIRDLSTASKLREWLVCFTFVWFFRREEYKDKDKSVKEIKKEIINAVNNFFSNQTGLSKRIQRIEIPFNTREFSNSPFTLIKNPTPMRKDI